MGYIYKITNNINHKVYIGQTKRSVEKRWQEHKRYALEKDSTSKFYKAVQELGVEHFFIEPLEEVFGLEERNAREKYWINYYNSFEEGYNSTRGGGCFDWENLSSLEKEDLIIELRLEGKSYEEICSSLNVGKGFVSNVLNKHDLLGKNALTIQHTAQILELLQQGVYLIDIQKEVHCDFKTIQRLLKEHPELNQIYYDVYYLYDSRIWQLLDKGFSKAEIARQLGCSSRTVYRAIDRRTKANN